MGAQVPLPLPPDLLEEYRGSARAQLKLLAKLADTLAAHPHDLQALAELNREVHRIRGTSGSYGFRAASRLAAGMDETVSDWLTWPGDPEVDRASIVRWFVAELANSLGLDAPTAPEAPQSEPGARSAGPAAGGSAEPIEVILVEDDPALAELLEYGLRSRGYRFVSFRNGRDALAAMLAFPETGTAPLVLLDVDLPALDGYSVFDALQRERRGHFRVVFTTVHGDESEQLRGLEAGALDYLVKPISLRVALEKIRRWVGR